MCGCHQEAQYGARLGFASSQHKFRLENFRLWWQFLFLVVGFGFATAFCILWKEQQAGFPMLYEFSLS